MIENKKCVVIGGGKVALRKVQSLLEAGGCVTVISPVLITEFSSVLHRITYLKKVYIKGDAQDCFLLICASDNRSANAEAAEEGRLYGALVDVADQAQDGDFITPAKVKRGPLTITISTDGLSPALTVFIKKEIEKKYNDNYIEFLLLLGEIRALLKNEVNCSKTREIIWQEILNDDLVKLAEAGKISEVKEILNNATSSFRVKS